MSHPIHRYYNYSKVEDVSTCKECGNVLKGKHATNLIRHLYRFHENITKKYEGEVANYTQASSGKKRLGPCIVGASSPPKKQRRLDEEFLQTTEVKIKMDPEKLVKACVKLTTISGRPLILVEDEGFREIIDPILASFGKKVTISRETVANRIHLEAGELKSKIKEICATKMIYLKVDAATRAERGFLGINCQIVENDEICLMTLGVKELMVRHTGANIRKEVLEVLQEYDILPEQVFSITTDNGSFSF